MQKTAFTIFFIFAFSVFTFGQSTNCPTISVTGPPTVVQVGETATFTVSISGKSIYNPQYVWSVSSGEIVEGQGTETLTVLITSDSTVTATVDVKGLPEGCANTDSESAPMGCLRSSPSMFDEFEISSKNPGSERLDSLISALEDRPTDSAYFLIYSHEKDSSNKLKSRENYIRNYLRAKKIEPERLVFVTIGGDGYDLENSVIRIWLVPQGAEPPTP